MTKNCRCHQRAKLVSKYCERQSRNNKIARIVQKSATQSPKEKKK